MIPEEVYKEHNTLLRGLLIQRNLGYGADDILQETWLRFCLYGHNIRSEEGVRPWLIATLFSQIALFVGKEKKQRNIRGALGWDTYLDYDFEDRILNKIFMERQHEYLELLYNGEHGIDIYKRLEMKESKFSTIVNRQRTKLRNNREELL